VALAACRECGAQVSTEAVTCPHCGTPRPASQAPSTARNLAFGGLLKIDVPSSMHQSPGKWWRSLSAKNRGLVIFGVVGAFIFVVAVNSNQEGSASHQGGGSSGGTSPAARGASRAYPISVGGSSLVLAYEQNEVAADQAWKGRYVELQSEIVVQISKDAFDRPYLVLQGSYGGVYHAQLREGEEAIVARLVPGTRLTGTTCRVDGLMLGTVILSECGGR
jgi:hypothetical protein